MAASYARERYDLKRLGEILLPGEQGSRLGTWIRRELYGTGSIPFVRTSDLSHWRVRPDYKKGVSEEVYNRLHGRQDVKVGDILMVAHGTYLVGNVAIVTPEESKLVLQDHVFRLRVNPGAGVDPHYLLAALSTRFVKSQMRARQFSADIIDKIGNRHLEVYVPITRDSAEQAAIAAEVESILDDQTAARRRLKLVSGSDFRMTRERAETRHGFSVQRSAVRRRILIPKYYDPAIEAELTEIEAKDSYPWVTLGSLVDSGQLAITTGVEVGKMAYGTGGIPFVRTSDIADLEIKRDIRHGISEEIYETYKKKAALQASDILLVRDGTYLVGSSAMCAAGDLPALICGGIFRLRLAEGSRISAHMLLASLNLPIVRRQMRARQFTRDVIDTLGLRILEVRIPGPTSTAADSIAQEMRSIMQLKDQAKARIGDLIDRIEPRAPAIVMGRPSWSMR